MHSDGRLTIKSLAAEARLKRWVLTHKHTDLQEEFRARVAAAGLTPISPGRVATENEDLRRQVALLKSRLAEAEQIIKQDARVVQVLSIENEQLRRGADVMPHRRTSTSASQKDR